MEEFYFTQNCSYCCSASSVAIIYNFVFGSKINEYDIFRKFPEWKKSIKKPIGLETLSMYVGHIFGKYYDTQRVVYFTDNSSTFDKYVNFNNDSDNGILLCYISNLNNPDYGHYTPLLNKKVINGVKYVTIGESVTHQITDLTEDQFLDRLKGYIMIRK